MIKVGYTAISRKTGEKVHFYAYTAETANKVKGLDAQKWIRENLETPCEWNYYFNGKFKFD